MSECRCRFLDERELCKCGHCIHEHEDSSGKCSWCAYDVMFKEKKEEKACLQFYWSITNVKTFT